MGGHEGGRGSRGRMEPAVPFAVVGTFDWAFAVAVARVSLHFTTRKHFHGNVVQMDNIIFLNMCNSKFIEALSESLFQHCVSF